MLPIILVLLVATSALAAPTVNVIVKDINDVAPPHNNGGIVSAFLIDRAFENVNGGETSVFSVTAQKIITDLANKLDRKSRALALAQAIGWLSKFTTGIPGDACAAANLIDTYVYAVRSGDHSKVPSAVAKFIKSLSLSIDQIVQLANNPNSLRFEVGPRGNCNGGGRNYQFEAAWDSILSNASPSSASLIYEQYCSAKRLYSAFSAQCNNVGAIITAVSLPPVNNVFLKALEPVARFVASISSGNSVATAAAAKKALARAAKV